MPTTVVGLLFFVALAAPGLVYRSHLSTHVTDAKPSALRETGTVVLASVLFGAAALGVFGILRVLMPGATPDVGALVRRPHAYALHHYVSLVWWGLALLLFACLIALITAQLVGTGQARELTNRRPLRWLAPRGTVTPDSAWRVMFTEQQDKLRFVGVMLTDQSYIDGLLWTYSPDTDETADREITLTKARRQLPGDDDLRDMHVSAIAIPARQIQFVTVTYLDDLPDPWPPPAPPAPAREPSDEAGS